MRDRSQPSPTDWPHRIAGAVAGACFAAAVIAGLTGFAPAFAADPSEQGDDPPCCGAPSRDEVTADQVFGRWVVMRAPIGMGVRPGDIVEFRPDGTVHDGAIRDGSVGAYRGACRFAILRAEMTLACADNTHSGMATFDGDNKLIWRQDGNTAVFIAPVD
ncbi:MAG: hypothetical protein KIT16_08180 [Rhodospirillaceae bacterium]|nr:hypothetical protein [Rhodospirillaceae bacterium]